MKLEIELDLNQIDYESINKQIAEKVEVLDIKDMFNIESKINDKITDLVSDAVDDSYNEYIDNYWRNATSEGRNLIQSMIKAEIENRTKQIIEEIFTNDYDEDKMREVMLKVIPDVFAYVLFSRMETTLFATEYSYREQMLNMIAAEVNYMIDNKIDKLRY